MSLRNFFNFPVSFLAWIISSFLVQAVLSAESKYEACRSRTCGSGPNISYPFYIRYNGTDFCGHPGFAIRCENGRPIYKTSVGRYVIQSINYESQSFQLVNEQVINTTCPSPQYNYTFDRSSVNFIPNHADIYFFYNCTNSFYVNYTRSAVSCSSSLVNKTFVALVPGDEGLNWTREACGSVVSAPVQLGQEEINATIGNVDYKKLLNNGFGLKWVGFGFNCSTCLKSGGQCGFEEDNSVCYCPDGTHPRHCNDGNNRRKLQLELGLGIVGSVIIIGVSLLVFWHCYKRKCTSSNLLSTNYSTDPSSKADLEHGSFYYGVLMFSYSELEEATNNFDAEKELGDGGFGTVYYGKLRDGREVAVKRLHEHSYKRVAQFINEVEILTSLRHKNLVTLYGCTSRRSRGLLLVYEYIPNGTVADHLHGDRAKPSFLTWPFRMSIAIETASALAYLHASDIIHRDVKSNNILLDNNFSVKVADFGLSRLFPLDVTHVSTAPQGTPGYVDPEYHQCYQLTDKSDVYSFGVVLIELISSMPAVDITRHRSEINLANLAINKIQKCEFDELIDPCLGYKSDEEVRRMTILVAELAFRCLQQNKEMRPSMEEVLEELQIIRSGEYEDNQKEVDNDNKRMMSLPTPPSPLNCDEAALLKNVRLPPSPDTVTNKWASSSCSTTTPTMSG